MNHTEVKLFGMHQKVRDEISNVLDCTDIGIDDVFNVSSTEMLSVEQFKDRTFYRVPCTCCEAYIKKYIPRNGCKLYGLAYLTNFSDNGARRSPYYRVVKLRVPPPVLDVCDTPSQNAIDGAFIIDNTQEWIYTIPTSSGRTVRLVMPEDVRNSDSAFSYVSTSYGSTRYVMDYNNRRVYYY